MILLQDQPTSGFNGLYCDDLGHFVLRISIVECRALNNQHRLIIIPVLSFIFPLYTYSICKYYYFHKEV